MKRHFIGLHAVLVAIVFSLMAAVSAYAITIKASIVTTYGEDIDVNQLASWIDDLIDSRVQRLIILTECYGGNAKNAFAGKANTAVASATSAGEEAYGGGYDFHAVAGLTPGPGKTAQDVHDAGTADKNNKENPTTGGGLALKDFPLDPTSEKGNVQSRHVLVYAGQPASMGADKMMRDRIKESFATQYQTEVHTVGGRSTEPGWDKTGSAQSLRDALREIGNAIASSSDPSKEQLILFVTDHGDLDNVEDVNIQVPDGDCLTVSNFPTFKSSDLNFNDLVQPAFCIFLPFFPDLNHPVDPSNYQPFFPLDQWHLTIASDANSNNPIVLTNYTELYREFDNNIIGDMLGEGVTLFFPVDRSLFATGFCDVAVNVHIVNLSGSNYTVGTFSQDSGPVPKGTSAPVAYSTAPIDFDGDHKADPAVYQPTNGNWLMMLSGSGYATTSLTNFGDWISTPAVADYDGDGRTDLAVYQPDIGTLSVRPDISAPLTVTITNFGGLGNIPVPDDYDGDGKVDPTVYQQTNGNWSVMLSGSGYTTITLPNFGGSESIPVPGDYDGDDKADPAVYNTNGTWSVKLSGSGYVTASVTDFIGCGDMPVPADFDGDGKIDLTMYNSTNGNWSVKLSGSGYTTVSLPNFGGAGFTPVSGDYDGDGKADPAVYQPTTGTLSMKLSASGYVTIPVTDFGGSGYNPVGSVW